jgi:hypothetical protein
MAATAAQGAVSGIPPPLADPSSAQECGIVWGSSRTASFSRRFLPREFFPGILLIPREFFEQSCSIVFFSQVRGTEMKGQTSNCL